MKKIIRVPQLETDRLILRMWTKKDAQALFEYAKDPDVGPNAGWKPHENPGESRMIIEQLFRCNMTWAIVEKETGEIIPVRLRQRPRDQRGHPEDGHRSDNR